MYHYPHHIADFNHATRHCTRIERSVYRDMLDMYYDTERALPLDFDVLCRRLLARSDEERTAVEQVLNEFFTRTADGWRHDRCDAEIARYHASLDSKSAAGRASAAKRAAQKAENANERSTAVQQPLNARTTDEQLTRTRTRTRTRTNKEEAPLAPTGGDEPDNPEPDDPAEPEGSLLEACGDALAVAQAPPKAARTRAARVTLAAWLDVRKATGESAIPDDDPVWDYAASVGIDEAMLAAAWAEFRAAYLPTAKKQADWRAHFRNAVRRNWYRLWFLRENEPAQWTTAGHQARRTLEANP